MTSDCAPSITIQRSEKHVNPSILPGNEYILDGLVDDSWVRVLKEMRMLKPSMVIVDKREERSDVPSLLIKNGLSVRYDMLEVGDYALPGDILVERKTVTDLVSSILDGRLFEQALNLSKASSNPTFIIEGNIKKGLTYFENVNAFWGALASLSYDFKLKVFFTGSPEETATLITVISKRKKEREEDVWVKPRKKKATLNELQIQVLTSFPGVGPATAKRLLRTLGSLREVFNAEPNILSTVGKMPIEKSMKVYEIINARYGESRDSKQSRIDGF